MVKIGQKKEHRTDADGKATKELAPSRKLKEGGTFVYDQKHLRTINHNFWNIWCETVKATENSVQYKYMNIKPTQNVHWDVTVCDFKFYRLLCNLPNAYGCIILPQTWNSHVNWDSNNFKIKIKQTQIPSVKKLWQLHSEKFSEKTVCSYISRIIQLDPTGLSLDLFK